MLSSDRNHLIITYPRPRQRWGQRGKGQSSFCLLRRFSKGNWKLRRQWRQWWKRVVCRDFEREMSDKQLTGTGRRRWQARAVEIQCLWVTNCNSFPNFGRNLNRWLNFSDDNFEESYGVRVALMMNLHNPSTGKGWEWDRLVGKSSRRINLRRPAGPRNLGGLMFLVKYSNLIFQGHIYLTSRDA